MKKILCFGDSNTYGYIPGGGGGRYDSDTRWTGILSDKLFPFGYKVIEGGRNGRTTVFEDERSADRNGSNVLGAMLRENDPLYMVIIMLGTNDCKRKFSADADMITGGMEVLISMIRAFSPDIRILLVAPAEINPVVICQDPLEGFDEESVEKSRQLKEKYRELARKTDCELFCAGDIVKADLADGVHLSAESHRTLAEGLYEYITRD